jgi:hypothetical protein
VNSALLPEIRSHWPLFNSSERHKGDRSADFSQSNVRRARKLASAYPSQLLQTFSHGLGPDRRFAAAQQVGSYWGLSGGALLGVSLSNFDPLLS